MTTDKAETVREAVGVFSEESQLKDAMAALLRSGFEQSQLGILASEHAVEEKLAGYYNRSNAEQAPEKAPAVAFISRDSTGEVGELVRGSLYFIGASGLAGAIVASSAVIGGALTAAIGGILGVGLVGAVVGSVIHQSDAEELQQRVDEGHILLLVRLPHAEREQQAVEVLAQFSTTDVKVYDVPVKAGEQVEAD